jgi:hypothetical protein
MRAGVVPANMPERPPSAVSLFTAVGGTIILAIGIVALVRHAVPGYFALWLAGLAVVIGLNLWAAGGLRKK